MKRGNPKRQRGAALLALLAVIMLGASWFLVSQMNAESGAAAAVRKTRNAEVLNRAKQALIGYVAAQAAKSLENNPGAMPCPENPGDFDDTTGRQGLVGTSCGTTAGSSTVGRFPWRTLGLDKLVDASGEPLWYVVGPGWGVASGSNSSINSNSFGQLTVDGAANDAIALIIAPGPAIAAPAATGCTAWNQVRPTTGTPDSRNYLECENADSDASFVTSKAPTVDATTKTLTQVSNDQVIKITVADVMPAIEAAIANRIEREIIPVMTTVYAVGSPTNCVTPPCATTNWGMSGSARLYPHAAAFPTSPTTPATSSMQGTSAVSPPSGLMPMTNAETFPGSGVPCTVGVSAPRCNPNFVTWASANMTGSTGIYNESCTVTAAAVNCTFNYNVCVNILNCGTTNTVPITVNATASNVGMAMRQLNSNTAPMTNVASVSSLSAVLNSNGSATMALSGQASVSSTSSGLILDAVCGLAGALGILYDCNQGSLSIPITVFADHPLLDGRSASASPPSTAWFARNNWHELTYYAAAAGYAPNGTGSCATGSTCLSVTNVTPAGAQRAILILSGRSINGTARPSSTLADYLDFGNATAAFERQTVSKVNDAAMKRPFNDRVLVVDSN